MKTPDDIVMACRKALSLAPKSFPADLPTTELLAGAPDWHPFEREAWAIGEDIRQAFSQYPKLKKEKRVKEEIFAVIQNRNLRRGRESFVMLLGFKAASGMAERIAPYLSDSDISGHTLDALSKMKVYDFVEEATTLLNSDNTWIRNKARKYIEKAEAEQGGVANSNSALDVPPSAP